MGFDTANLVDFYFNTFHGESVKEEVEIQEEYYSRATNEPQFIPAKHLYEWFFKTLKDEKLPFDKGQAEKSLEYVFALSLNVKSNWSKYIKNQGDLIREAMTHYMKAMRVGGVIEQLSEQQVEVSEAKGVAFNVGSGSGAKRRIMSPNESVVGYYSIYAQYDSGEIELLLSKSDTVIGLEHYRMRMSNAKKIGRSGKLPKNFGGKPMTLDTLYQMIMAKVPDKSKAFGLQAQVMESVAAESVEEDQETVSEYRRYGYRSTSYSGDPRWITAKYAGRDANGKPFKAGERVLYFPNGKKFYTGAEAEKAWLEFLSAKGDEEGMPFAR
jgi:hypothetical protein